MSFFEKYEGVRKFYPGFNYFDCLKFLIRGLSPSDAMDCLMEAKEKGYKGLIPSELLQFQKSGGDLTHLMNGLRYAHSHQHEIGFRGVSKIILRGKDPILVMKSCEEKQQDIRDYVHSNFK
jgi:hypothetical protein